VQRVAAAGPARPESMKLHADRGKIAEFGLA
jgi:hypothetical protein